MKKKDFLFALMSCCLLFNNINVTKAEDNNLMIIIEFMSYFNISDTKKYRINWRVNN